jgi:integrase
MSPVRFSPPRCPKPALWPEIDRRRWEASQHTGDIFDAGGAGAGWAPITRKRVEAGYGRWISWLSVNGYLDSIASPGDRVQPERVTKYVAALQALNAPSTVLCRVQELYLALTVIAPERDWTWIHKIESRIKRTVVPARNGRRATVSSDRLCALGLKLMAEAEEPATITPVMQAVQYRDGLMISLLAAQPLRRRNFAAIEIGRHLVKQDDGYWIRFEAAETKTKAPIEYPFPTALVPYLEKYLSVYRPLLAQCDGYWNRGTAAARPLSTLWLSQHGTAMAPVAVSCRFKKLTKDRLGRAVTMHRFRDSAATTIAIEDPEHVRITMCILGHTTLHTSERYYNHATSLQAVRRYQAGILELRRTLSGRTRKTHPRDQARTAVPTRTRSPTLTKGS